MSRTNLFRPLALAALVLVLSVSSACGGSDDNNASQSTTTTGSITVVDAWVRPAYIGDEEHDHHSAEASPASEHNHASSVTSAIYLTLENTGSEDQRLVSVSTDAAEMAEIHETTDNAGTMQMRPVEGLDVPTGERVEMTPGNLHIMLMGLHESIEVGDDIEVTLTFASGLTLEIDDVEVRDQ